MGCVIPVLMTEWWQFQILIGARCTVFVLSDFIINLFKK